MVKETSYIWFSLLGIVWPNGSVMPTATYRGVPRLTLHFFPHPPYEMLSYIWGFPKPSLGFQFRQLGSPWDRLPWDPVGTLEICDCCYQFTGGGQERQGICNIVASLTVFCLTLTGSRVEASPAAWLNLPNRVTWVLAGVKSLLECWVRVPLLHWGLSLLF